MTNWLRALDRILRGEATSLANLREGNLEIPTSGLLLVITLLGVIYGFCMGWFALFNRPTPEYLQVPATMIKVPALFFLTLLVTFPSLYVFNALVGSRLTATALCRLLVAALAVTLAVLASFGPIVAFFSLTTDHYPFMVLLNVIVFAVAGGLGLVFLLQTLNRLTVVRPPASSEPLEVVPVTPGEPSPALPGALQHPEGHVFGRNVQVVFRCWVIVFALVGAQMAWVLRPFVGNPHQPFEWFRDRHSNFFEGAWRAVLGLFS